MILLGTTTQSSFVANFVANLGWAQWLTIAASIIVARILYALFLSPLRDIPGPFLARFTRLWQLRQIVRGDSHDMFVKLHEKHGPVVRIAPDQYSFNSLEDQKKIYTLKGDFIKSPYYTPAGHPYRTNIFSMRDEAEHADRKKHLANLYSMSSMVHYEEAVDRMNAVCIRKLKDFAKRSQAVLIPEFMQCYAFDVIGEITLDQNFGMMEAEGDVNNLMRLVQAGLKYQGTAGILPEWHKLIYHLANLVGLQNAGTLIEKNARARLANQSDNLIDKADPKAEPFITKLLKLEAAGKIQDGNMLDAISANISAGSDTTAITLSAALYHIYRDPRVLETLRDEIDSFALESKISDPVRFAEAQHMPYLQAVIMETLRLHSAVGYFLPRIVPKGGAELAGRFFPEGTTVGVSAWALHRNKDIYGDDAAEFKPERFLESSSGSGGNTLASSFAFGGGTRTCLGKNISMLEMMKVVPQIVRKFDLVVADGDRPWELYTNFFVWQKFYCFVKAREG